MFCEIHVPINVRDLVYGDIMPVESNTGKSLI